jgi:uncharacterized protein (TIGR02996 family)
MNEESALLQALAANPDDTATRLVFADWLMEHGDPRAAWVRDDELQEWMKPDAQDPLLRLLAAPDGRRGPPRRLTPHPARVAATSDSPWPRTA